MERPPDDKTAERLGALARQWVARRDANSEWGWSEADAETSMTYKFGIAIIAVLVVAALVILAVLVAA